MTFMWPHRIYVYIYVYVCICVCVCGVVCVMARHYNDVIMGTIASQITSLTIVYSTVYSDADQRKHQSSASLAFVWGIRRGPVNSPHKWPVTRNMFPLDDVIMAWKIFTHSMGHSFVIFVWFCRPIRPWHYCPTGRNIWWTQLIFSALIGPTVSLTLLVIIGQRPCLNFWWTLNSVPFLIVDWATSLFERDFFLLGRSLAHRLIGYAHTGPKIWFAFYFPTLLFIYLFIYSFIYSFFSKAPKFIPHKALNAFLALFNTSSLECM